MKRMAEVKDMCFTPPARAPKSQLTGEQPLTGGHLNPPQKTPHMKDKGYHNDMVGGVQS